MVDVQLPSHACSVDILSDTLQLYLLKTVFRRITVAWKAERQFCGCGKGLVNSCMLLVRSLVLHLSLLFSN